MNKNIDINIVLLNNDANIPQKQHDSDIGYDIYSVKNYNITPKKVTKVKTGVSIELPEKYGGFILFIIFSLEISPFINISITFLLCKNPNNLFISSL